MNRLLKDCLFKIIWILLVQSPTLKVFAENRKWSERATQGLCNFVICYILASHLRRFHILQDLYFKRRSSVIISYKILTRSIYKCFYLNDIRLLFLSWPNNITNGGKKYFRYKFVNYARANVHNCLPCMQKGEKFISISLRYAILLLTVDEYFIFCMLCENQTVLFKIKYI